MVHAVSQDEGILTRGAAGGGRLDDQSGKPGHPVKSESVLRHQIIEDVAHALDLFRDHAGGGHVGASRDFAAQRHVLVLAADLDVQLFEFRIGIQGGLDCAGERDAGQCCRFGCRGGRGSLGLGGRAGGDGKCCDDGGGSQADTVGVHFGSLPGKSDG